MSDSRRGGRGGGRGRGGQGRERHQGQGGSSVSEAREPVVPITLNERFEKLASRPRRHKQQQQQQQTHFRAVINDGAGNKRRSGGIPNDDGRPGKKARTKTGSKDSKGQGGKDKAGQKKQKTKPVSKEDLDKQLDVIMGRDPKESMKSNLDDDLDSYWSKKPADAAASTAAAPAAATE